MFNSNGTSQIPKILFSFLGELNIISNIITDRNLSRQSADIIFNSNTLSIKNVYPNPFNNSTKFTFELSAAAEVRINIYTIGGKKIKRIENRTLSSGFHTIEWVGRNEFGSKLANGVYIYKVNAKNNIDKTSHIGRCAKFK